MKKEYPDELLITFKYTDYLVCGPFIEEKKDLTLKWRGSYNQQIIDLQATNINKKITYFIE